MMVRCSDLDFNHTSVACDECWEREKIAMRHRENTEKMDKLVLLFDALVDKNVLSTIAPTKRYFPPQGPAKQPYEMQPKTKPKENNQENNNHTGGIKIERATRREDPR